jgi:hypothetical protein
MTDRDNGCAWDRGPRHRYDPKAGEADKEMETKAGEEQ